MAKKTAAQNSRRAVIDDIRKKQASADRRRGMTIIVPLIAFAVLIVAAAAYSPIKDWWDERKYNDVTLAEIGAPASVCSPITTKPADGNQSHVPSGEKVTYTDAPPAFGAHWNEAGLAPEPMAKKFYAWDERPALESLVHNLEHGYSIVWYDATVNKDSDQLLDLRAIANKFPGNENFRYKMKIVPWYGEEDVKGVSFPEGKHIAISHWSSGGAGVTDVAKQVGAFQYCDEISGEALKTFMDTYPYMDSPEPNAG